MHHGFLSIVKRPLRWLWRALLAVMLILALSAAALHLLIVPRIDHWRPWLQQRASKTLGMPVQIGALQAQTRGLNAIITLNNLTLGNHNNTDLQLAGADIELSASTLWHGGISALTLREPQLTLRRPADGRWLLGGVDLNAPAQGGKQWAADWVMGQPAIRIQNGSLRWVDERPEATTPEKPVLLTHVNAALSTSGVGRHHLQLAATPAPAWGQPFSLDADMRQRLLVGNDRWQGWRGQIKADAPQLNLAPWVALLDWHPGGVTIDKGAANLRLQANIDGAKHASLDADIQTHDLQARLDSSLTPLRLDTLRAQVRLKQDGDQLRLTVDHVQPVARGSNTPTGELQFAQEDLGNPRSRKTLRATGLDLATVNALTPGLPIPPAWQQKWQAMQAVGKIKTLRAEWAEPQQWQVSADVSQLGWAAQPAPNDDHGHPQPGLPGAEGLDLMLQADITGGHADLAIHDGALSFPGVFEEPRIPLAAFSTVLDWTVQDNTIDVRANDVVLRNDDASGRFKVRWHSGDQPNGSGKQLPGILDIQGKFDRADGARAYRYLPLEIPQEARDYVQAAIVSGQASDVTVQVQGRADQIPFDEPGEQGVFRIAGQASDVVMQYVPTFLQDPGEPPWPALENLSGELVFDRASMQVNGASSTVKDHPGWNFKDISASIDRLDEPVVKVKTQGSGALPAALGIVRQSPITALINRALDEAQTSGASKLDLNLELPIDALDKSVVGGQVTLDDNQIQLEASAPNIDHTHGVVRFSHQGFSVDGVEGQSLGGTVTVSGGMKPNAPIVVQAHGHATADALRQNAQLNDEWAQLATLAEHANGGAPYDVKLVFDQNQTTLQVSSDLQGLALNLPAPLAKNTAAAWPLQVTRQSTRGQVDAVQVLAPNHLAAHWAPGRPPSGNPRVSLVVGSTATEVPKLPVHGAEAHIRTPQLDADQWLALARDWQMPSRPDTDTNAPVEPIASAITFNRWSLDTEQLRLAQRDWHEVHASGERQLTRWFGTVKAREMQGNIRWQPDSNTGLIHARLTHLDVPKSQGDGKSDGEDTLHPHQMPALDVAIDALSLNGKKLGQMQLHGRQKNKTGHPATWQLSKLALTNDDATLTASGSWQQNPNAASHTKLSIDLQSIDSGDLLARFKMPGVLEKGAGTIGGELDWPGAPWAPKKTKINGQLQLDVGQGQFLKADPGIAKLLGVLSLQALPRRLTLDFRDVFSNGFAFDSIQGDVSIEHGVAQTNNLQTNGLQATVLMKGSADLAHATQDLHVAIVPKFDAGGAALVATVINPALGLGAFLAQLALKAPLAKVATREFQITGGWSRPKVTPLTGTPTAPNEDSTP